MKGMNKRAPHTNRFCKPDKRLCPLDVEGRDVILEVDRSGINPKSCPIGGQLMSDAKNNSEDHTMWGGPQEWVERIPEMDTNGAADHHEFITGCQPKLFRNIVSGLSREKIVQIEKMGFGPVHLFRCGELNAPLCDMLIRNFNVKKGTIKIHGRNFLIEEKDFERLMGLNCGGYQLQQVERGPDASVISELKRIICGEKKFITIERLRYNVVTAEKPDHCFASSFVLLALSVMYCPSEPGFVDPGFLSELPAAGQIKEKNWARIAFAKLQEEVCIYQLSRPRYVGGCIAFLQIFYLTVIAERMYIVPRPCPPAITWGRKESNRIYERVEMNGGFQATQGIWVTKRYSTVRSSEFSGSHDYSTGLRTNVVDDVFQFESHMAAAEDIIGILEFNMGGMAPDIADMRKSMLSLYNSVSKLKEDSVAGLVDDVVKEITGFHGAPDLDLHPQIDCDRDNVKKVGKWAREKQPVNWTSATKQCHPNDSTTLAKQNTFATVKGLSKKEVELLNYLYSDKAYTEDSLGSVDVARFQDFSATRWDVQCLSPKHTHTITSEVINIMGEYCFANRPDWWFLGTIFSDRARDYIDTYKGVDSYISATITICRLRKYYG